MAFAFGARTGVRTISSPSLRNTSSKLRVNLLSRSRIKKRSGVECSGSDQTSWRACCVTHAPPGSAVQPASCTRRLPSSMKKSTYNRWSETVSTVKKSTASMLCACARRNSRQESPARSPAGPRPACRSSLRTVVAETVKPSPLSSPAIRRYPQRGYPQRGFSRARRSTSSQISRPIGGRPRRPAYVQRLVTSSRCQRRSVAGVTTNER